MKKCATLLVTIISILLGACQKTQVAHIDGLTMHEVVLDTIYTLGKEDKAPLCHVSVHIQYAEGKNAQKINAAILGANILFPEYLPNESTDIPSAVKTFVNQYIRDYHDTNSPLYKCDSTHGKSYTQSFQLTVSTQSRYQDILTYIATIETKAGEQPETIQTIIRNIDTRNGHTLSLDDIYMHGAEKLIKAVIVRKLAQKHGTDGLEGLREQHIFAESEVYIPDNFIIERNEVTFIYQQGEIAPYEEGELRIAVSRTDIGKLMKQDICKTTSNNTL